LRNRCTLIRSKANVGRRQALAQLALNDNLAAKAYQQANFQQGQPAVMFFTADIKGDYERIKARGAKFTMPPTEVTGSTIAKLNDTCGNLIQITQLARW
jgi:predicted enzyme related to lactoylglutathione lyase